MIRKFVYRIVLVLSLTAFKGTLVNGQDFPQSLQYITNMHTINPAFVGMWDQVGLFVSTRTNWVGIEGAPTTQQLSYFTPMRNQKSGVGLDLMRIKMGREKRLFLTGDYSYMVRADMTHYLRFGLKAGIVNYDNNLQDYQLYPDQIPDPEFASDIEMYYMTVFGFGAVFFCDEYFISLSVPQVINNTFKVNRNSFSSVQELKTVYLSGGYVFKLRQGIRLRPNLLVVGTVGQTIAADASALIYLPGNLQFGLNVRTNGMACASGQYTFPNGVRIGFAADYAVTQDIRKFQLGTYEVVVGYDFNLYRKRYTKPAYF